MPTIKELKNVTFEQMATLASLHVARVCQEQPPEWAVERAEWAYQAMIKSHANIYPWPQIKEWVDRCTLQERSQ